MDSIFLDGRDFLKGLEKILDRQYIPEYNTPESIAREKKWQLVLALASNPTIIEDIRSTNPNTPAEHFAEINAKILLIQADAIIKQLEKV